MGIAKQEQMFAVCLDSKAIHEVLFQSVIQYKIKGNGEAVIILPKTVFKPDIKYIKELPISPQYIYGEQVSPCNHPDIAGIICGVSWHLYKTVTLIKFKLMVE